MPKVHEPKLDKTQPSRAPKLRLETALLSPPRTLAGCGILAPRVTVKRTNDGDFVILRDPNWASKVKELWAKACQASVSQQDRSRLFLQHIRKEAEKLEHETRSQVLKAKRLIRRILAPRKKSPHYPIRCNFVLQRPRSRQLRRHGQTRAPTDGNGDGESDGDGSDCGYQIVKYAQKTKRTQKLRLDGARSVKPQNFTTGGVIYAV